MTARFVLDEWSWIEATETDLDALSDAVHQLLERLDVARERNEGVVRHQDYYETSLGDGVRLFSALFEPDCPLRFDHDLSMRLYLALDRINEFDDTGMVEYDAEFGGSVRFAPGVVWGARLLLGTTTCSGFAATSWGGAERQGACCRGWRHQRD